MSQARQLIEGVREAFVSGDVEALAELVEPGAEIRNPFTTVHGPEGFVELARGFVEACSERRIDVLRVIEDGEVAMAQLQVSGRHTGTLALPDGEAPPTGNEIRFEEAGVVRVRGDRIASWHSYYDGLALAQQLGVVPAAAAT